MRQLFRGSACDAIAPLARGLTLSAYDPQGFVWYNLLALAQLFAGRAEAALAAAIKARKVRPAWRPAIETLACSYASLGRMAEAQACVAEMYRLDKSPGDALAPLRARNPQWAGHMESLLESAARRVG
jgi:predicted Zn-dependent protease